MSIERLSVSLPAYLVEFVRVLAKQKGTTRSAIVAEAIAYLRIEERRFRNMAALQLDEAAAQEVTSDA